MSENVKNEIKAWITPGLITCFWIISWSTVNEIKADLKKLLEAKAQTEVIIPSMERRIDNVEKRMDNVEQKINNGPVQSIRSEGR
jgi:hypothetical protein